MSTKNPLMVIAVVSCAAFGSSAYAGSDAKVMAGSACQFTDPTKQTLTSVAFQSGNITNTADQPARVVCPVVRDNINNLDGIVAATMRVRGSAGVAVLCFLRSRDRFGTIIEDDVSSGGANGPQSVTLDVSTSSRSGSYDVSCRLPKNGSILTYQVSEFTPTVELE